MSYSRPYLPLTPTSYLPSSGIRKSFHFLFQLAGATLCSFLSPVVFTLLLFLAVPAEGPYRMKCYQKDGIYLGHIKNVLSLIH